MPHQYTPHEQAMLDEGYACTIGPEKLRKKDPERWRKWMYDQQMFDYQLDHRFPKFIKEQAEKRGLDVKYVQKVVRQKFWDPDLHGKIADDFQTILYPP